MLEENDDVLPEDKFAVFGEEEEAQGDCSLSELKAGFGRFLISNLRMVVLEQGCVSPKGEVEHEGPVESDEVVGVENEEEHLEQALLINNFIH